jgi:ABC-2 type transport system permease protein
MWHLRHHIRLYARLQLVHLRAALEYEADFWLGIVGVACTHGAGLIFLWALFANVPQVAGWSVWEVALLYALSIIPRGLVELLADGAWDLRTLVNRGELDRLLLRPLAPAMQVLTHSTSIHGLGSVLLGGAVLVRASIGAGLNWTPSNLALLLVTLASSTVLIGALNLLSNSVVFWEPSTTGTFPFMAQNFLEFAKFPLSLYHRLLQGLLTWVLPFAFVSYYPGLVLLGRPEANTLLGWGAPGAGLAVALLTALVWHAGLRRYQGTGH